MNTVKIIFGCFLLCGCLQRPQPHDNSESKSVKLAKGVKGIAELSEELLPKIDNLVKSGKRADYDELTGLLGAAGKSGKAAIRAFRSLVSRKIDVLDDALEHLDTTRKNMKESPLYDTAIKNASDDVDKAITELATEVDNHHKSISAVHGSLKNDELSRKLLVQVDEDVAQRWHNTLYKKFPWQYENLKTIGITANVTGGIAKKSDDMQPLYNLGYVSLGFGAAVGLKELMDRLEEKLEEKFGK